MTLIQVYLFLIRIFSTNIEIPNDVFVSILPGYHKIFHTKRIELLRNQLPTQQTKHLMPLHIPWTPSNL